MNTEYDIDPAEKAFERSSEMTWNGQKLQPFSFLRKTASMRLGLKYWKLRPDEVEIVLLKDETGAEVEFAQYKELPQDIATVLWLSTHSDEDCRRARDDNQWGQEQIDDWAEGKIFNEGGLQPNGEAWMTFLVIVGDIIITTPALDESEKKSQPETMTASESATPSSISPPLPTDHKGQ